MENLIEESEKEKEFEGEEDTDSDYEDDNINSNEAKTFWNRILPNLIYPPIYYSKYWKYTFSINESQKADLINPYYLRCSYKACRHKSSMRAYSILKFVKRIPASITYAIKRCRKKKIEKKCAKDIQATLK